MNGDEHPIVSALGCLFTVLIVGALIYIASLAGISG